MRCPRCTPDDGTGPYRSGDASHLARMQLVRERHRAGIDIDRCGSCYGAWLDPGELERIQSAARARGGASRGEIAESTTRRAYARARASKEERPQLACPSCGDEMFEREWGYGSLILVDACAGCRGVWVDGGELDEIEQFAGGSVG